MNPGQEVVQRTPAQELVAQVRGDGFQKQVSLALPESVPPRRFVRAVVTAVQQDSALANDPDSLFTAALKAAQDGLLPDGREAAFVIFGGKAAYLPMIGGLRKIAAEYGWALRTRVVYENDEFEHTLGLEEKLHHVPVRPGKPRGSMIAAYAVASHRDRDLPEIEVMYADDIEKVRKVSRAGGSGPWRDWPERMWEKTVGRRLFAKLPLDENDRRVRSVLDVSDLENGKAAEMIYGPDRKALNAAPASSSDGDDAAGTAAGDARAPGGEQDQQSVSSVPGSDEEPKVSGSFAPPEKAIDDAGDMLIPKGDPKGKSIAEVAGTLDGQAWIAWALRRPSGHYPEPFRAALEMYVEHRLPDLWAAWQAERDGGEA